MSEYITTNEARLARIEAALIQSIGFLGCVAHDIPQAWESQLKEKQELLAKAVLDTTDLKYDLLERAPTHGTEPPPQIAQWSFPTRTPD